MGVSSDQFQLGKITEQMRVMASVDTIFCDFILNPNKFLIWKMLSFTGTKHAHFAKTRGVACIGKNAKIY